LNNLVASFHTIWWHPSTQFGGILPNNLVASFHTIWWHPSKQFGSILPHNLVASFCIMSSSLLLSFPASFLPPRLLSQIHFLILLLKILTTQPACCNF
jgi:hypothetical protein